MLQAYVMEWGSALLRWLHVIAAMAWIGASFFFMHLDASLRPRAGLPHGASGESWQVHGGGFYNMTKYLVAPDSLPDEVIWHKWQSYWTWISGFCLLCWVYYGQSSLYLVDPAVLPLTGLQAAGIGIVSLGLGWLVYDGLCRSPLAKNDAALALVGFGYVVATSWAYTHLFSGRGAMLHTGALMATMMTGNVFLNIIPNQHKVVASLKAGEKPEAKYGKQAKQRSTHNNYITLPVVFMMLSNHYPVFWSNAATIPLIVTLVIIAGALIRVFFNLHHAHPEKFPIWPIVVAVLALAAVFAIALSSSPGGRDLLGLAERDIPNVAAPGLAPPPQEVVDVVTTRCSMCHSASPVWEGIQIAPKGVMLDTPERIARLAGAIKVQAVLTHAMPPNNITDIPQDERDVIAKWLRQG